MSAADTKPCTRHQIRKKNHIPNTRGVFSRKKNSAIKKFKLAK